MLIAHGTNIQLNAGVPFAFQKPFRLCIQSQVNVNISPSSKYFLRK